MAEGMARLCLRSITEEAANIRIALDVSDASEVEITAVRLGFTGEGSLEVFLTFSPL